MYGASKKTSPAVAKKASLYNEKPEPLIVNVVDSATGEVVGTSDVPAKVKATAPLRSMDECVKWLKANDLWEDWYPRVADDNELQLDIDSPNLPEDFDDMFQWVSSHIPMEPYIVTESRSGNKHVIIRLKKPLSVMERIALQAIMGSDVKREFFDLINARNGDETPILLFEKRIK